jgi:hypothetical protein
MCCRSIGLLYLVVNEMAIHSIANAVHIVDCRSVYYPGLMVFFPREATNVTYKSDIRTSYKLTTKLEDN